MVDSLICEPFLQIWHDVEDFCGGPIIYYYDWNLEPIIHLLFFSSLEKFNFIKSLDIATNDSL